MSDHTPTTEEVRESYARSRFWPAAQDPARAAFFDRWLAAHDAEVRAAALAEQGVEWEYVYESIEDAEADRPTMRRRKAGPWLPVPADETEGAGA